MRTWWRCRSARTLVQALLLGCVLLLIWGGIWLQVRQERAATERAAIKETSNLALAFEENIIRSIAAIDQVLLIVRDSYARDPGRFDLARWVSDRPFINDQTFQLSLIDASGMLVQSNLAGTRQPVDLSDREHFRVHVGARPDSLFISKPLLGRVSNRYSVQFTRRVIGLDGEFLGVVVASLDPSYLARFYESLQIGGGFVMLVGLDGYVRAGRPVPGLIGRPLTNSPLLERASLAGNGNYQLAVAEMTERPAIVSYRRLADYPLVVLVGYGSEEVFAPYRQHRFQYVGAGIGLSALVLCIGTILAIHRRRLAGYQDRLTATLENMSQGIIMVDRDRRVGVINRRVRDLLGLPPELMHEDTRFDAIIRWQREQGEFELVTDPSPSMVDPLEAGVPVYEQKRPNGAVLEVRTVLLPNGGAVRTYTDITEQKRNELEIAAARDAAEEAGRARSRLLAVMSHEIRTPLNGIIGAAGLLLDHKLEAEDLHYVRIIRQSGDHLLHLISDILDFTRLDASCMELEEVSFDLRATFTGTVDMLAGAAHAKGLDLTLAVAEDTPRCAVGDAGRLRQVLLNLIGNAIKFTERGSVHVTVAGKRHEAGGVRLAVEVHDTGIGIPRDALPRLFQEFGQVDGSISRRFGGSGLGLAISRQLVERMAGSLFVNSAPGVRQHLRIRGHAEGCARGQSRRRGRNVSPAGHSASAARSAGRGQRHQSYGRLPPARAHGSSCRRGRRRDGRGAGGTLDTLRAGPDGCNDARDGRPDRHQDDPERARAERMHADHRTDGERRARQRGGLPSGGHGWFCQQAGDSRAPRRRDRGGHDAGCRAEDQDACVAVTGWGGTGPTCR